MGTFCALSNKKKNVFLNMGKGGVFGVFFVGAMFGGAVVMSGVTTVLKTFISK